MSAEFVIHLRAEISELEEEIRSDPRYRRLQRLREVLADYEPVRRSERPPPTAPRAAVSPASRTDEGEHDVTSRHPGSAVRAEVIRQLIRRRG